MTKQWALCLLVLLAAPAYGAPESKKRSARTEFIVVHKPDTRHSVHMPRWVATEAVTYGVDRQGSPIWHVQVKHARPWAVDARMRPTSAPGSQERYRRRITKRKKPRERRRKLPTLLGRPEARLGGPLGTYVPTEEAEVSVQRKGAPLLHDPYCWSTFMSWAPVLKGLSAGDTIRYIDVSSKAEHRARIEAVVQRTLVDPANRPLSVQRIKLALAQDPPVDLYVDPDGELIGVRRFPLYMIRKGWSWGNEMKWGLGGIGTMRPK